jgi:predicted nucleic acid-binding protein
MNYLFDTNILVYFIRKHPLGDMIIREFDPFGPQNITMISIVTQGEILSLCHFFGWGEQRKLNLTKLLNQFLIIPIEAKDIVDIYAEIDAFGKGKLPEKSLPAGTSSRNMGKNDLWIAATAFVTKSTLLTTDDDFDHLDPQFIDVVKLKA